MHWSAVQSCSWDERIVSVQFKEEMNIWFRATFATTTHNNQPPTLRLGEEDNIVQTNSNRMQQYSVILARNLSLDVYTKVYTTNWVEKQWQFTTLRLAETIHNRRRDSIDSYHTSRVWIVVVMRSASGSELIGTIFFENKTIYDGVIVEARKL